MSEKRKKGKDGLGSPVSDADLDALLARMPPTEAAAVGKMVRIMKKLDMENAMMRRALDETSRQQRELFGILFILLRRCGNEARFTLEEIDGAGLMENYRVKKWQDRRNGELVVELLTLDSPIVQ